MSDALDLHRVLGALNQSRAALEVDTSHLCYLVVLWARSTQAHLTSLAEDLLVDLYLEVCELIEPDAANPRKRATHAIQHLREQRLLRRVDGVGLVRAGEYTLTGLAVAIVEFFVEDETLTRESLVVLMRALISQLGAVLSDTKRASDESAWQSDVIEPLRITVRDLVSGIERRQRGMDAQQEEVRQQIGALLQADWFSAVGDCEALLDQTSGTLQELNDILLGDTAHLQTVLQEIEQWADDAGVDEALREAQNVQVHLERVAAWGTDRQRAWSKYYQFVQRYLRDVVRLDPDRAVSQRLRDQLGGWLEHQFFFAVAKEPSIRLLREQESRVARPPVTRRRVERDFIPELMDADAPTISLEVRVIEALRSGSSSLTEVLDAVLPHFPAEELYRKVGQITAILAEQAHLQGPRERGWRPLKSAPLVVEEWVFDGEESR